MIQLPTIREDGGETVFDFGAGMTVRAKPLPGRRRGHEVRVLAFSNDGQESVIGFSTVDLSDLRDRKAFQTALTERDGTMPDWSDKLLLVADNLSRTNEARAFSTGVSAADVEPREVRWIWRNRIPAGRLAVLGGDPDVGKSMMTIDLAARFSVGSPWPDGAGHAPHGSAIILTVEDDLADTVVPRLALHGADLERVKLFGPQDALDYAFPEGFEPLEQRIREQQEAFGPDVLLVFDPLEVFVVGGSEHVDTHRTPEVRAALAPLEAIFNRTQATGIGLMHLNKKSTESTLYRFGGALAFVAAARAALIAGYDPEDAAAEDENQRLRVFANAKSNLGPKPPVLSYRIVNPGVIKWEGTVTRSISDLLRPTERDTDAPEREEAKEFLQDTLSEGGMPYTEIMKLARQAGHSERTLKRAKAELGIVSKSDTEQGRRGAKGWLWEFPDTPPDIKDASPRGTLNDGVSPREEERGTLNNFVSETPEERGTLNPSSTPPDIKDATPDTHVGDLDEEAERKLCSGSAKALDFPEIVLGPGRKVAAGEEAWSRFTRRMDLGAIRMAQAALDRLGEEGQRRD